MTWQWASSTIYKHLLLQRNSEQGSNEKIRDSELKLHLHQSVSRSEIWCYLTIKDVLCTDRLQINLPHVRITQSPNPPAQGCSHCEKHEKKRPENSMSFSFDFFLSNISNSCEVSKSLFLNYLSVHNQNIPREMEQLIILWAVKERSVLSGMIHKCTTFTVLPQKVCMKG